MKRYILPLVPTSLLVAGCATVLGHAPFAKDAPTLSIQPQVRSGAYLAQAVSTPYASNSINHVVLRLYTVENGVETPVSRSKGPVEVDLSAAQLTQPVTFGSLRLNTTYRVRAFAYAAPGTASIDAISVDASSSVDIPVANGPNPTAASLPIQLKDRVFAAIASSSIQLTEGSYASTDSVSARYTTMVSTFAGTKSTGAYADGVGASVRFNQAPFIATAPDGTMYTGDMQNHVIRKISPYGVVTTFAGLQSEAGSANGTVSEARFDKPCGICIGPSGNLYVGEYFTTTSTTVQNFMIRKITPAGVVSTLAGARDKPGYVDATGTAARFGINMTAMACDSAENVYVLEGASSTPRLRKITPVGVVTTFSTDLAGGAIGLAVDAQDNLFVAEPNTRVIKRFTPDASWSIFVGSGQNGSVDGVGTAAKFVGPRGLAFDRQGNLLVGDTNQVRRVTPEGVVTTLAGMTSIGYMDGEGSSAKFNTIFGLSVGLDGTIYASDYNNYCIRKIR